MIVGPDKLPGLARSLGKSVRAMKKAIEDTTEELTDITELKELKKAMPDLEQEMKRLGREVEKSAAVPPASR